MNFWKKLFRAPFFLCSSALLSGCSIIPDPLSEAEISRGAQDRLATVTAAQEPVRGAIGLYEAMARALKYNLDHKVEIFETTLRNTELHLTRYDLLPDIVAQAGYAGRESFNASSSRNLITGAQNFGASTSREKEIKTSDIQFSWHILDFGLSYVRARQAADKVLIAAEMRRKIANRIIEDVRTAFWRALSAQYLISKLNRLERRTRKALIDARRLATEKYSSPITSLSYERELVEIKRTIQELNRDLSIAKQQLSALMNLPPNQKFRLTAHRSRFRSLEVPHRANDMIWAAMQNRPELRELDYRLRINMHEAHAALLELLPGIQAYVGANYDSNDFLLNDNWVSWGAKASWNLIKVINYPARRAVVDAQDDLLRQRALATTMAIMTQIHVARIRFKHFRNELVTARQYLKVQRELLHQIRAEAGAERIGEQTLIREEMNTLVAEVRRDIAYSNIQNAYANIYASMGLDGYWSEVDFELSVGELANSLRRLWHRRATHQFARSD